MDSYGEVSSYRRWHTPFVPISWFLPYGFILLLMTIIGFVPYSGASASILKERTLKRWPDPIVADCGLFSSLLGKPLKGVRLLAWRDGRMQPIPFQIDERDANGDRVYLSGEEANPEDSNRQVDVGDELVFMARDTGDRVEAAVFSQGAEAWEEVELTDSLTGGKSWCYLLYTSAGNLPLSSDDYVHYEEAYHPPKGKPCPRVTSAYVDDRFYPMSPYFRTKDFPNNGFSHFHMANTPKAGGDNSNYVDRMKTRFEAVMFFGTFKWKIDENRITFHESAYTDGPVRIIRNIKVIISLPLGLKAPGIGVDLFWYDTIVDVPLVVNFPLNPATVFTYIQISLGEDQSPAAYGMLVFNSNNPGGMIVDGRMSPMEKTWNIERDRWRLLAGPQGSTMRRSFWDPVWAQKMISLRVDYADDVLTPDPPEEWPGFMGCIVQSNRVKDIARGRYNSYLEWYWPPRFLYTGENGTYRKGDERTYLNMADHPVKLTVGTRTMESRYFGPMPKIDETE